MQNMEPSLEPFRVGTLLMFEKLYQERATVQDCSFQGTL